MKTVCQCSQAQRAEKGTLVEDGVVWCRRCQRRVGSEVAVDADRVTTLGHMPGHRIVRIQGVVSVLSGSAGLTAEIKGNEALDEAMGRLRSRAGEMGSNAVVGLHASTFGAGGGITSVFGGDAVGVLLLGTAVTVEPEGEGPSQAFAQEY